MPSFSRLNLGTLTCSAVVDSPVSPPDDLCPFCRSSARIIRSDPFRAEEWECIWCGRFVLLHPYNDPDELRKHKPEVLRGLAIERMLRREGPLVVGPENIDYILSFGPQTPVEQADRFLVNLSLKSSEPGIFTALTSNRHPNLAFCAANDAFVAWLGFLQAEGLIEYDGERRDTPNDLSFRLTLAGWRRVAEIQKRGERRDAAFVAMPFRADFDDLWRVAVEPALSRTGWRAIRADKTHHTHRIDDWILNQIRAVRFLIADTTGSNPGACFEAGFALGLDKLVVWIAEAESFKEGQGLHFDIRQYNHLKWVKGREEELVEPLVERILNTVGRGPIEPAPHR